MELTREQMLERLRSIAQLAVEAQSASDRPPEGDNASELENLVADIESDLIAVNDYLSERRSNG